MEPKSTTAICHHWLKGKCQRGVHCRYVHQHPSLSSVAAGSTNELKDIANPNDAEDVLVAFEPTTLDDTAKAVVGIENFSFVASYNWSNDTKEPTIFVPGCPPRLTAPPLPTYVQKDTGVFYTDQNTARSQNATFDPFFKSLLAMNPQFDMNSISIVIDRKNLQQLLRFASDYSNKSFTIDVDMINNTMFFTRREPNNYQIIRESDNHGCGHEFEKAFTTLDKDLEDTTGHYRIVQYDLGGFKCLARYEADAYIDEVPKPSNTRKGSLEEAFESQPRSRVSAPQISYGVKVIERGRLVPPSSVMEIKTRKKPKGLGWADVTVQTWIAQTQHLMVGYHQGCFFDQVTNFDLKPIFKKWEAEHQSDLKKLVSLFEGIKEAVKSTKNGKCVVVCDRKEREPRTLRVYGSKGKAFSIPKEARAMFWGNSAQRLKTKD